MVEGTANEGQRFVFEDVASAVGGAIIDDNDFVNGSRCVRYFVD